MANTNKKIKAEEVNLEEKIKEELKEELLVVIDGKIKKSFNEELERSHKRLIREKNRKILFRNIVIVILLIIIFGSAFYLYKDGYFNKFFNREESKSSEDINRKENNNDKSEDEKEEKKEPTLDELINSYGKLLDNIIISENSTYLEDYYNGNLTNELKNYIALNKLDFNALQVEDDCNIIDEALLESVYSKLFNDYKSESFNYNGNKIRYIKSLKSYLTDSVLKTSKSNIKREIIDIKVDNDKVIILTVEGLLKDNKLYNILTNEEIKFENKNDKLSNYEDKLNKVKYTFKNNILISLDKQ